MGFGSGGHGALGTIAPTGTGGSEQRASLGIGLGAPVVTAYGDCLWCLPIAQRASLGMGAWVPLGLATPGTHCPREGGRGGVKP